MTRRILNVVSVMMAVLVLFNLELITMKIAVGIVNILTRGIPIIAVLVLISVLLTRFTWRMRRRFWGW